MSEEIKVVRKYGQKRDRMSEKYKYLKITPSPVQNTYPPQLTLPNLAQMPVYDQMQIGSCTANSLAGAFEYEQIKQGLTNFTPSRLFIYYNERVIEHTVNVDSGAALSDGITVLNTRGVPPETMWQYNTEEFTVKPPLVAYTDALKHKAVQDRRVNPDVMDFKTMINLGYPIAFGFTVSESFENIGSDGIMPIPKPGEEILGGHAVLCCGYNDTMTANGLTGYLYVRNSWGPSFAQNGYFWMSYEFLTPANANDCWIISKNVEIDKLVQNHLASVKEEVKSFFSRFRLKKTPLSLARSVIMVPYIGFD